MKILTCLDWMAIKTVFQNLWKVAKPLHSKRCMALNVSVRKQERLNISGLNIHLKKTKEINKTQ